MYQFKRITMAFCGVTLCGLCVGMLQKANLGVDPFTCFVTGIANIFSSTYSTFYLILTGILLLLVFVLRRHYIGIATIINLLFTGIAADVMHALLDIVFPHPSHPLGTNAYCNCLYLLSGSPLFYCRSGSLGIRCNCPYCRL